MARVDRWWVRELATAEDPISLEPLASYDAKDLRLLPSGNCAHADLLKKMLVYDPAKRIHATEALEHPYFDTLDKSRYAKIEAAFEKENRKVNA